MGYSRSCCNGTTSALQPEEITSKGTRVSSIKVLIRKKSGNLFNDPRIYIYIYKQDVALNNQRWLISYKTEPSQRKSLLVSWQTNKQINKYRYLNQLGFNVQSIFIC